MKYLYKLALAEGEGLGTAYEYYVKLRLLNRFLKNKDVKDVLVYGLPEKYGLSLDFFLLAGQKGWNVSLLEERQEKVGELKRILAEFGMREPRMVTEIKEKYDLILSCEVLQQDGNKKLFADNVKRYSKNAAIFVPNVKNKGHVRFSGLGGLSLKGLCALFGDGSFGYIDMPLFPPGVKSDKKYGGVHLTLARILALLEQHVPKALAKRHSHMVYALT